MDPVAYYLGAAALVASFAAIPVVRRDGGLWRLLLSLSLLLFGLAGAIDGGDYLRAVIYIPAFIFSGFFFLDGGFRFVTGDLPRVRKLAKRLIPRLKDAHSVEGGPDIRGPHRLVVESGRQFIQAAEGLPPRLRRNAEAACDSLSAVESRLMGSHHEAAKRLEKFLVETSLFKHSR